MSHDRHASSTSGVPEENSLFVDILHEAPLYGHRKPTRILGSILYCILLASYAIIAVAAPWIFLPIRRLIPSLLCSCNAVLLIITGIFQHYLIYQVQQVRLQGYYIFSQKLKHIIRLPFSTVAYGTAAMLLVMVWQPYINILSLAVVLRIIMFVEAVCAGSFMSAYIGCVHQYNSLNSQPDVLKSLYSSLQPSSSLEELRNGFGSLYIKLSLFHFSNQSKKIVQARVIRSAYHFSYFLLKLHCCPLFVSFPCLLRLH
ncbi:hypothetical protein NE237_029677 [Protea cynaroides]|uniref:Uncharacterized protein n=1 Tax=Protea cynaroides TaxID=273540 RepID=A0A9Q0GSR5_9MAGN|nr:hypothetical protein NE237_029677 [Protea cynaroides]